jgi:bacteriophage N4 adsorption protein B
VWLDRYWLMCLVPLALWILISGLDDLFICLVFLFTRRKPFPWPADAGLAAAPERRIAIFVPLWREHRVIGQMLEHNLAAIHYSAYDVFVGVYPNDAATADVVEQTARLHPRVHMVIGPHNGPTSKGDCLNWIYRGMSRYEALHGVRFDVVMTHDAEDLVHPQSLRLVSWFSRDYAMVQVPVLPLATPFREIIHGLYCDEFAEFQTKDIPVRQWLGGFLPANGVGTGFSRAALDHLASTRRGLIFDPECLTEDYENGFRLHALGYRQIFLPVRFQNGIPVATREYFPRNFRAATRQRSRWVAGIALQGWQHHGWRGPWRQRYWFWRDRKGLVGNLLSPFTNLVLLAGLVGHPWRLSPPWLGDICLLTCLVALVQVAMRTWCCARIYGWRFASGVPLRASWGNVVNFPATVAAVRQFTTARFRRRSMAWRKTDHVYPRPRLGEVLAQMHAVAVGDIEKAALELPKGLRIGEYLVQLHKVSEENLYHALSLQTGIPIGPGTSDEVERLTTRSFPAAATRRWNILPYRVETGTLHVATADIPSGELARELRRFSALEIRYHLVPPSQLSELAREYLPYAN